MMSAPSLASLSMVGVPALEFQGLNMSLETSSAWMRTMLGAASPGVRASVIRAMMAAVMMDGALSTPLCAPPSLLSSQTESVLSRRRFPASHALRWASEQTTLDASDRIALDGGRPSFSVSSTHLFETAARVTP